MYKTYLVDDEQKALEQLVRKPAFGKHGYEIAGCTTESEKAVEEIMRISPDVVFTDLSMPDIGGIQLMVSLKSRGCKAEFVIVSTFAELAKVRRFFVSHEFEYLIKPVNPDDLAVVLSRVSDKLAHMPPRSELLTTSTVLNEILAYLSDYSAMRHSLDSISDRWGINPNTVCNLFSKHLDTNYIAYLTELRMKHAEDMLINTSKSIKEVAYTCGYNDYFYFCRVFKENHNCAPTNFRAANFAGFQKQKEMKAGGKAR